MIDVLFKTVIILLNFIETPKFFLWFNITLMKHTFITQAISKPN